MNIHALGNGPRKKVTENDYTPYTIACFRGLFWFRRGEYTIGPFEAIFDRHMSADCQVFLHAMKTHNLPGWIRFETLIYDAICEADSPTDSGLEPSQISIYPPIL